MEALREEIYDYTSDPAQESFRNQQYQRSSVVPVLPPIMLTPSGGVLLPSR